MTSDRGDAAPDLGVGLDADDFELFDLAPLFVQDRAVIDASWKALLMQVHPDRFASLGAASQRVAMQWALRVNEAHQRLKTPLTRAAYLCELHGQSIDAEANTALPAPFLVQQMAWREALDEARSAAAVEVLAEEVSGRQQSLQNGLAVLIDELRDWAGAATQVRELMFMTRLLRDIDMRQEALG